MCSSDLVSQRSDLFGVRERRRLRRVIDGIQIRYEGNRHPVDGGDVVVPTDHRSGFVGSASPQHAGRLGTHPAEIDGDMPGRVVSTAASIGLSKQQANVRPRARRQTDQYQKRQSEPSGQTERVGSGGQVCVEDSRDRCPEHAWSYKRRDRKSTRLNSSH